jgi:hypothetical protein
MTPNHIRIPYTNLDAPVEALIGNFLRHEGTPYIITDAYMEGMDRARLDLRPIPDFETMPTLEDILRFAT